ncbi:MAG TPA: hypothetical protein DIW47_03660 [Bacteroidetes bacterium]|nr:hypothetical protein [Bacteroidota bacterium]
MDKKIDLSTYLGLFHDTLSERYGLDKNDKFYEEDFSYLISSLDIRFFLSSGKDGLILIALQNPLDRALEYRTRDNTILWVELDRELKPQKVLFPDAGEVEFFTSHMSAATHHMLPDSSILISNFTIHNTQLVLKNEKRLMYFEINDPCVFHKHDPATGQTHCFYSSEELDSNEDLRINAYATEMNNSLVEEGYWPEFIFKNNMFLVKRPEGFENYERHISNMLTVNLHNGESTSFSFEKHVSVLSFLPTNNGIWLVMDDPEGGSRLCFYRFN